MLLPPEYGIQNIFDTNVVEEDIKTMWGFVLLDDAVTLNNI